MNLSSSRSTPRRAVSPPLRRAGLHRRAALTRALCAVALTLCAACAHDPERATVRWSAIHTEGVCPQTGRYNVTFTPQTICIDKTGMDREPCEASDPLSAQWRAKAQALFAQSGCIAQTRPDPRLPTLNVALEEIRFEGGHTKGEFGMYTAMLLIPVYVYLAVDLDRAVSGRARLSMSHPDGRLLWEATLHHQERFEGGINDGWAVDPKSPSDAPRFDRPTSLVLSSLLQKALRTTEQLNAQLRNEARP